ncbi:uncharacterized protein LOC131693042 [Topomyia yanbarensis]|uniref:uncharacterized protein LOC131693042 n=1 Tax=Topomyia yanbarensis TaxID=2498891 RepID=UPI00273C2AF4|nr:uncharacterized protein LOC131693042 [Topomyia yanbarensis]
MQLVVYLAVLTAVITSVVCSKLWDEPKIESNQTLSSSRQGRVFPFYSLGRIANTVCVGTYGLSGTCQIRGECAANGGIASGICSTLTTQAVCCVFVSTCGATTSQNITYFQNSGYPLPYNGGGSCSITVVPPDASICQLRIDFDTFSIAQPTGEGVCSIDNVQVSGGSSSVPIICGDNNGQHAYVWFSGTNPITITVSMTGSTSFNRLWNMQLSMISCHSRYQAPAGCLQYYMGLTGTVSSFNYGMAANPALNNLGMIGSRQLVNSNYGICIGAGAGQCTITYNLPSGNVYAFTLSGDATAVAPTLLGTAAVGVQGTGCTTDYLIIPNPVGIASDRFCGLGIGTTTSNAMPFVLYYITGSNSDGDVANRGFQLQYTQGACAVPIG